MHQSINIRMQFILFGSSINEAFDPVQSRRFDAKWAAKLMTNFRMKLISREFQLEYEKNDAIFGNIFVAFTQLNRLQISLCADEIF